MPTLNKTIEKVRGFEHLPIGWRFDRGVPVDSEKIGWAINLLKFGRDHGIERFNAFAGEEGEVMVSFYHLENSIDLTLEINGTVTFAEDEGDEQIDHIKNLDFGNAFEKIWQFAQNTQEQFTQTITTLKKEDLRAFHSSLHLTAESPFSISDALSEQAGIYANTPPHTTQIGQAFPRCIGKSQPPTYRTDALFHQAQALAAMGAIWTLWGGAKKRQENILRSCRSRTV